MVLFKKAPSPCGSACWRVVGWSAGRHVDHPCGGQISPWPAGKVTEDSIRGHLTCTNKRAQANEQKIARNERFFSSARHAHTWHVFNVGPK